MEHMLLPLAALKYNTSYPASVECEPRKVFHRRISDDVLDRKLGKIPNRYLFPSTKFARRIAAKYAIANRIKPVTA